MGGHSPSSDSGSADAPTTKRSTVTKVRGEGGLGSFIAGGGVTGMVVRAISGQIQKSKAKAKDRKTNDSYLGSPDYQGDVSKKSRSVDARTGKDNDRPNQKSIEQPKVKSQMNNSEIKSGLIVADKIAPTDVEMTAEEKLVARKRGKKTKTILSSVTGDNTKATLSKKTLLG